MNNFILALGMFLVALSVIITRGAEVLRMLGLKDDSKENLRISMVVALIGLLLVCYTYPNNTYHFKPHALYAVT